MTVIKGCEGIYLRFNNLDYSIGNDKKLDDYSNGTIVKASIVRDDKCYSDRPFCSMVHDHPTAEGSYRIKTVKLE